MVATPLFYYTDDSRLVARNYAAFVAGRPNARIWVIVFPDSQWQLEEAERLESRARAKEIFEALTDFRMTDEVTALGIRGLLYQRPNKALSNHFPALR